MNTIKFEKDKIITTTNGIKEVWNLKNIESSQFIKYNGKKWFLKDDISNFENSL